MYTALTRYKVCSAIQMYGWKQKLSSQKGLIQPLSQC